MIRPSYFVGDAPRPSRLSSLILFALSLGASACGGPDDRPSLRLTADSTALTVRKGCGRYGGTVLFCTGYHTTAVKVHLDRNGYEGDVSLASNGPNVSLAPRVLTDTQSVSTLSIADWDATGGISGGVDSTFAFTATATAPGTREAILPLMAKFVWDPTFRIDAGNSVPWTVMQGGKIVTWIAIHRYKYPDPVTILVSPGQQNFVLLSPNPTTGDSVAFVFDASALTPGSYTVELLPRDERFLNTLRYYFTVTPAP